MDNWNFILPGALQVSGGLHLMATHMSHRQLLLAWPSLELVILSQCLLLQVGRNGQYANMFRLGVDERMATVIPSKKFHSSRLTRWLL